MQTYELFRADHVGEDQDTYTLGAPVLVWRCELPFDALAIAQAVKSMKRSLRSMQDMDPAFELLCYEESAEIPREVKLPDVYLSASTTVPILGCISREYQVVYREPGQLRAYQTPFQELISEIMDYWRRRHIDKFCDDDSDFDEVEADVDYDDE